MILPMISLKDFFVNSALIYPTGAGTCWLNKTRPTVVSINFLTITPPSRTLVFTLMFACKSTRFSLYAMITSSML